MLLAGLLISSCSSGGGGSSNSSTTIIGNISSANARGEFEGISVTVQQNPQFTTTTDSSGAFQLTGVPSGPAINLIFSEDGQSASMEVETPANTTVILQNININITTNKATASQTVFSSSSAANSSASSSSVSSDDDSSSSDDDSSSSDDSSDDDSSDDDSSSSDDDDSDDDDDDDDN